MLTRPDVGGSLRCFDQIVEAGGQRIEVVEVSRPEIHCYGRQGGPERGCEGGAPG
ncbi:MAG: hypothetical protein IPN02_18810 [Candidatus Microthrix sp.]|uniref:Uncharacterized protein n=1 Tax=Candidatus Neomicrothrix subdominans TaxID=2954438 RepID=A0A936NH75_9ACTN|nr:hypothetical protein [Candidatus Microthrix subdominans]